MSAVLVMRLAGDAWHTSEHYEDANLVLRQIAAEPVPLPGLRPMPFGRDLEAFRERLASEAVREGTTPARVLDLLLAATEVATNAVAFGGGVEEVRVGRAGGRFVCEIVDRGSGFDDPSAGYLAPRNGSGAGLWVARQLTWQIEFFGSPSGFTARIWL